MRTNRPYLVGCLFIILRLFVSFVKLSICYSLSAGQGFGTNQNALRKGTVRVRPLLSFLFDTIRLLQCVRLMFGIMADTVPEDESSPNRFYMWWTLLYECPTCITI